MRAQTMMIVVAAVVVVLLAVAEARYYKKINNDYVAYDEIVSDAVERPSEAVGRVKRTGHMGVTGPVHTFQKTNKEAHFKWGVKHLVGHHFAG